jgi:glucuronoarabinoxylan endo-1,4-beta-xylanase
MAIAVDFTTSLQTMDGFGAASAFAIPFSTDVADFLFRADVGIGLSLLREEITPNGYPLTFTTDGNPAPGSAYSMWSGAAPADDHTYALAAQAYARGATVWGTLWAFQTAWQGGSANGALQTAHYGDAATLFQNYVSQAWALGIPISYVGLCNEPDITPSYAQTSWTTAQLVSFTKSNAGPTLASWGEANPTWQAATGLSAPGIIVSQTAAWSALATWINAFEGDSTALGYVSKYATHQYFGGGASAPPSPCSRVIWETEAFDQADSYDASITQAMTIAALIHNAITTGNASAWHYWFAEDVSDTNNSGLVGTNAVNWNNQAASNADWLSPVFPKRAYCVGQFSKFVRPGWKRVSLSGAPSGVNATAYMDPTGKACAIVCINTNASSTAVTVNLTGLSVSLIAPWVTDASNSLTPQTIIPVSGSSFNFTLGATSITTFASLQPAAGRVNALVWA